MMGRRAVVVLHGYSPAEQALAQRRQLQPPYAVSGNASGTRLTFTFTPSVTDWTSTLTALPLPSTRLIQRGPGGWQRDFTVERQRPGLAVHRQHAPAVLIPG
ncbi:hypothetical protein ACLK17_11235 [Escherichia coli]